MRAMLSAILLLGVFVERLDAVTYYVRKTGNDGNTGTAAGQAWLTIDKAADTALAGDVVYVGAGTYNQEVTPSKDGTSTNPIKFIADITGAFTGDVGDVIMTSSNAQVLDIDGDEYVHFIGFKILAGDDQSVKVKSTIGVELQDCEIYSGLKEGVFIDAATVTFTRCIIRNHGELGVDINNSGTSTFVDCDIYSNNQTGIYVQGGGTKTVNLVRTQLRLNGIHGVYMNGETLNLTNCLIRDNTSDGLRVNAGTTTVWHTTLFGNSDGIEISNGTLTMRNSIVANNTSCGIRSSGGSMTRSNNCVSSNSAGNFSGTSAASGETTSNPQFWSSTCLELKDGSPCIDTGTSTSNPVTNDIEQTSRPREGGFDMGCYETVTLSYSSLVDAYTQLNPYAWWRLGETSGTTATDQKGNHHGTYNNGVVLNQTGIPIGGFNKAASFDGSDDRVSLGVVNPSASAMTFFAWMNADTFSSAGVDLLAKTSGTLDSNYFWSLSTAQTSGVNYLRFRFRAGGSTGVVTATADGLSTNAWVFVAATYDGNTMILYKDGGEVARVSKTGAINLSSLVNAAIGDNPAGGRAFDGQLDEVAIFTKALKPREIATVYASALKGSLSGTVTVPRLWGIDEDDAQLFSMTNYNTPTTTMTNYGRLKWNNGGTISNFNTNLDNCAIARRGRMYSVVNENFGTYTAPVLVSFDLSSASTTGNNVVGIVGQVPTSTELRGLSVDPLTDELYALRNDGWLYVLNPQSAAIVRTVGQATGLGESITAGEDLMFDRFGNLYALDDSDDEMYRLSKANGAILEVYNNGGSGVGLVQGMAWDHINSRMLVTVTDSQTLIVSPLSLSGYSFIGGFGGLGLTDVEAIDFQPTEGITGVFQGVRVVKWQEKK